MADESTGGRTTTAQDWNSGTGRNDSDSPASKGRWKDSKAAGALRGAAAGSQAGTAMLERSAAEDSSRVAPVVFGYRKGGKVRKTERALVHKGERVIPRGKVKRVDRLMKRNKMRMKARS